jgi:hypothetical protein
MYHSRYALLPGLAIARDCQGSVALSVPPLYLCPGHRQQVAVMRRRSRTIAR